PTTPFRSGGGAAVLPEPLPSLPPSDFLRRAIHCRPHRSDRPQASPSSRPVIRPPVSSHSCRASRSASSADSGVSVMVIVLPPSGLHDGGHAADASSPIASLARGDPPPYPRLSGVAGLSLRQSGTGVP